MDSKAPNPLAKHFRQPAIYLKLPSQGQYWPEGALNLPVNGEIAIYPMTTKDEITLRTPDALMNGTGVVSVIQSCCPEIRDAWKMPSVDVDATIIAIRIASYGHEMAFTSQCPSCQEVNDYGLDLRIALDNIRMPDYSSKVEVESLKIKPCPQPYFSMNDTNQAQFEQQKLLQAIENTELDAAVRSVEIDKHMNRIVEIGAKTLASNTEYIELEDGTRVTDKDHLTEFYLNTSSAVTKGIQEKLSSINEEGTIKPMHVNCTSCNHPFDIQVTFDYSSFFASGF